MFSPETRAGSLDIFTDRLPTEIGRSIVSHLCKLGCMPALFERENSTKRPTPLPFWCELS